MLSNVGLVEISKAFDAEFARLLQEAKEKNAKQWKAEKEELLKRIAKLEKELARLEKMMMQERNTSRVSTAPPSEVSETLEELSITESCDSKISTFQNVKIESLNCS